MSDSFSASYPPEICRSQCLRICLFLSLSNLLSLESSLREGFFSLDLKYKIAYLDLEGEDFTDDNGRLLGPLPPDYSLSSLFDALDRFPGGLTKSRISPGSYESLLEFGLF